MTLKHQLELAERIAKLDGHENVAALLAANDNANGRALLVLLLEANSAVSKEVYLFHGRIGTQPSNRDYDNSLYLFRTDFQFREQYQRITRILNAKVQKQRAKAICDRSKDPVGDLAKEISFTVEHTGPKPPKVQRAYESATRAHRSYQ